MVRLRTKQPAKVILGFLVLFVSLFDSSSFLCPCISLFTFFFQSEITRIIVPPRRPRTLLRGTTARHMTDPAMTAAAASTGTKTEMGWKGYSLIPHFVPSRRTVRQVAKWPITYQGATNSNSNSREKRQTKCVRFGCPWATTQKRQRTNLFLPAFIE